MTLFCTQKPFIAIYCAHSYLVLASPPRPMKFLLSFLAIPALTFSLTGCGILLDRIFDRDDDFDERSPRPRHRPDRAQAQKVIL